MAYDFKKLEDKIAGGISHFESETSSLRTGRANPALVEDIKIDAYGTPNPLKNIAAISIENAKTIIVQPWDRSLLESIEKGIAASNIGLRPVVAKDILRVILPDLTEERRQSVIKILKEKLEESRVSVRKARDEVWREIQGLERQKKISEDEKFRLKEQMEDRIKKATLKIEGIAKKKEGEILD